MSTKTILQINIYVSERKKKYKIYTKINNPVDQFEIIWYFVLNYIFGHLRFESSSALCVELSNLWFMGLCRSLLTSIMKKYQTCWWVIGTISLTSFFSLLSYLSEDRAQSTINSLYLIIIKIRLITYYYIMYYRNSIL